MSKPVYTRLGDIVNFKRGYDLPHHARQEGPYPVISSGGISGYHAAYKASGEGLVTGRYGTLGEAHYVTGNYWPHNTALYVTDFKGNYPKYVYFLMKCLGNLQTADKSTVPGINRNDLHEVKVPYHKPSEQKAIADLLWVIDDKIALNTRINAELEAMAKLLYDYWFVQFDFPNAKGKPYKSSGGAMVHNTELKREVPKGWEVGTLSNIANITMGQSPPGSSYNETGQGSIFYQGCTDFGTRYPTCRQYTTAPTRFAKAGDILLSVRAPVGTMNIAIEDCCIGRGVSALNSKTGAEGFLWSTMQYFKQIFDRWNVAGTTFGAIGKDELHGLKVAFADPNVIAAFEAIVKPMYQQQNILESENRELTTLRDWLLPMLMNGQVVVGEAAEQVPPSRSATADNGTGLAMAAEAVAMYGKKRK